MLWLWFSLQRGFSKSTMHIALNKNCLKRRKHEKVEGGTPPTLKLNNHTISSHHRCLFFWLLAGEERPGINFFWCLLGKHMQTWCRALSREWLFISDMTSTRTLVICDYPNYPEPHCIISGISYELKYHKEGYQDLAHRIIKSVQRRGTKYMGALAHLGERAVT